MTNNSPKRGILSLRKKTTPVPVYKAEKSEFDIDKLYFVPLAELPLPGQYESLVTKLYAINIELNLKPAIPTIGSVNQISESLFQSMRDVGQKTSALYQEFKANFNTYVEAWYKRSKDNPAYINRLKNEYQHLLAQDQIKASRPVQVTVPSRFEELEQISSHTISPRPAYYELKKEQADQEIYELTEEQEALIKILDQHLQEKLTGFTAELDEGQKNLFLSYWGLSNHYFTKNEYASQYNLSISEVNRSLSRINKLFCAFDENIIDLDKKAIRALLSSTCSINFEELLPKTLLLFYAPYRIFKMLEMLFQIKPEHLYKYHSTVTVKGITYALLSWYRLPIDLTYLKEFFIVNYDYLPYEAQKIVLSYEELDYVTIKNYQLSHEPLPPTVRISQFLLSHPNGMPWEDIVLSLDIYDTDKIPEEVKSMRTLFYSGMGEFSHVSFIQASPDFIDQLIANALDFLQNKDTESCYLFEFINQLPDDFQSLTRYQIKHLLRTHGFQYNIILTDEHDDTLMALSKKSTSMAYFIPESIAEDQAIEASVACENLIIKLLQESAESNISETIKSIATKTNTEYQTVKRHIDSLIKKQIVYKINVNKNFVLFDHYFKDIDFDQVTSVLVDLFNHIQRPAEMSALCKELSPLFEIYQSKNFLEDIILVIAQRHNWFINQDMVSMHSTPYASLREFCQHNLVTGHSINFNIRNIYNHSFALFKSIENTLIQLESSHDFSENHYHPSTLEELDGYLSSALQEFKDRNYGFQKFIIDSKLFVESESSVKDRASLYHYTKNVLSKIETDTMQILINSFEIDSEHMDKLCANSENLSKALKKTRQCFDSDKLFLNFISKLTNNKKFTLAAKTQRASTSSSNPSVLNYFWKVSEAPAKISAVKKYLKSFVKNSDEVLAGLVGQNLITIENNLVSPKKLDLSIAVPHVLSSQPNGLSELDILTILSEKNLLPTPVNSLEFFTPELPCYKDEDFYFHENQFTPYLDILDSLAFMIEQYLTHQDNKEHATLILSKFINDNAEMIHESLEELDSDRLITIDSVQHAIRYFIEHHSQKHNLTFNTEKKLSVKLRTVQSQETPKVMDIAGEITEQTIAIQEESSSVSLNEEMTIPAHEYVLNCMEIGKEYSEDQLTKKCYTLSFAQLSDALYTLMDNNQIVKNAKHKYKRTL